MLQSKKSKKIKKGALLIFAVLCVAVFFKGEDVTGSEQQVQELLVQDAVNTEAKARERKLTVCISGAVFRPGIYKVPEGTRAVTVISMAGGTTEDADYDRINLAQKCRDGKHIKVPRLSKARKKEIAEKKQRLIERRINLLYGCHAKIKDADEAKRSEGRESYVSRSNNRSSGRREIRDSNMSREGRSSSDSNMSCGKSVKVNRTGKKVNINRAGKKELESLPGVGASTAEKIILYRSRCRFGKIEEIMQVPGIGEKKFNKIQHLLTL